MVTNLVACGKMTKHLAKVREPYDFTPPCYRPLKKMCIFVNLGTLLYSNGDEYQGFWSNDQRHGRGRFVSCETGAIYEGEYAEGNRHGVGTLYFASGDSITGRWKKGVIDGPVEYHFAKGSPWLDPDY